MSEEWRSIPGFSWYDVSTTGRVRSYIQRGTHGRWTRRETPRELKRPVDRATGYRVVNLYAPEGTRTKHGVHQLVMYAFGGERTGPLVCHRNGDPEDNRLTNLYWGTHGDNERDKAEHGRAMRGEKHHSAKLTETDVRAIRELSQKGLTNAEIARRYNITGTNVYMIKTRRSWAHVY